MVRMKSGKMGYWHFKPSQVVAAAGQEKEENGCFGDQSGGLVTSDQSAFSSEELGSLLVSQPAGIKMSR